MRFQRRGPAGAEQPVVSTGDEVFDLRPLTADLTPDYLAADGVERVRQALTDGSLPRLTDVPERAEVAA